MSDTQFKLIDTSNGIEKTFESRSAAEEKKQELDGLGGPYEIKPVSENGNGAEAAETPTQPTDDVEVVDHAEQTDAARDAPDAPDGVDTTGGALDSLQDSIENDPLDVLPAYMITTVEGKPTLNKRGVSVLAYHYGVEIVNHEILYRPIENDFHHAAVRIRVKIDDGREYVGTGEAHVDEMEKERLLRMAETRAYKRAVIFATGTGIVGYQELVGELE